MAAGITYTPIAETTLGSAASSVTFSSISGSYTDLVVACSINTINTISEAMEMYVKYNSDSGSNYSSTVLRGNGSTASSARYSGTSLTVGNIQSFTSANSTFTPVILQLQNYSNSTTYKTTLSRWQSLGMATSSENRVGALVGLWRSTSAITSIEITSSATGGFVSGSTFSLYGILSA